jgi:hypothetical protein
VAGGTSYYVQVDNPSNDAFAIGSYVLEVRPDSAGTTPANQVGDANSSLEDSLADGVVPGARHLGLNTSTTSRFQYGYRDALTSSTDVNGYRVRAPNASNNQSSTMTVVVWAQQAGGLNPTVKVVDRSGQPVASQVVLNENGAYDVQVANATPNTYYYVLVGAADRTNPRNQGAFFLGVSFNMQAVTLNTLAQASLTDSAKQSSGGLSVTKTQQFHFALSASSTNASQANAVRMTIYDANGNVVATLVAHNGETRTLTVLLTAGNYTVRFAAATQDGSALAPLAVNLSAQSGFGDDLGPQTVDPTSTPPGNSGGTPTDPTYQWSNTGTTAFNSSDSYSNPWW